MFAATSLSSATRATCAIKVRGRARKVIDAGGGAREPAREGRDDDDDDDAREEAGRGRGRWREG
jgi:hypothetical protein